VVACPRCGGLARYETVLSGNTLGARVWTDGKMEAPMLPRPPEVARCSHCGQYYWLTQARKVGSLKAWETEDARVDPAWRAAPRIGELSEAEYYEAIHRGLAQDPEEEKTLRILAWWRSNDAARRGQSQPTDLAPRRENLQALVGLLAGGTDEEQVMRAEALRELGRFAEAEAALARVTAPELAWVVRQIRSLSTARDVQVRVLEDGE
jgi:hypothetical protein